MKIRLVSISAGMVCVLVLAAFSGFFSCAPKLLESSPEPMVMEAMDVVAEEAPPPNN